VVYSQNLKIAQSITQAQFVIRLELVAVASPADALKVFSTVWISRPQSPDESCWHNVIHMSSYASLPKIQTARLHFALSAQRRLCRRTQSNFHLIGIASTVLRICNAAQNCHMLQILGACRLQSDSVSGSQQQSSLK